MALHDSSPFLACVRAGIYVPCITPFAENYVSFGLDNYRSADEVFRCKGDIGKAIADTGSFVEFLSYLSPERRQPFVIAFSNLASVLTYFDLNHPGFSRESVARSLVEEGMYPQYIYFVEDIINSVVISSQLLGLPVLLNKNYEAIVAHKFRAASFESALRPVDVLREFLSEIELDIPEKVSVSDILQFRESDAAIEFRAWFARLIGEARGDPSVQPQHELMMEFLKRVQRFNQEAGRFGETQIVLLSGLASTIGNLVGGTGGAVVGGLGAAGVGLLMKSLYTTIYDRSHRDWAVLFNRWSSRRPRSL